MRRAIGAILVGVAAAATGCCNANTPPPASTTGAGASASTTGGASTGAGGSSSGGSSGANSSSTGSASSSGGSSTGGGTSNQAASSGGTTGAPATSSGTGSNSTTRTSTGGSSTGAGATGGSTGIGYGGSSSGGSVANTVALIDNDGYVNDGSSPSDDAALAVYQTLMTGYGFHGYDTLAIDSNGDQSWNVSNAVVALPTPTQLAQYDVVVWFTSDNDNGAAGGDWPVSSDQETNLSNWLDLGDKKLVLISPYLVGTEQGAGSGPGSWTFTFTDALFGNDLFLAGGVTAPFDCVTTKSCTPLTPPYGIGGSSLVSMAFGMTEYYIQAPTAPLLSHNGVVAAVLNPGNGEDSVATVDASPQAGTANQYLAVTLGARQVGAQSSSTVVLISFPLEAIAPGNAATGLSGPQVFFDGVLTYAGIVP